MMSTLYDIDGSRMEIYITQIEEEMEKMGVLIYYTTYSNVTFKLIFIYNNINFKTVRMIKKFFMENIPYVTNVVFDRGGFIVELTRKFGLDTITVDEYY